MIRYDYTLVDLTSKSKVNMPYIRINLTRQTLISLYHSSTSVYLPTWPSHFISADIWRGWCNRTRVNFSLTFSTTHLPVFTYLHGLPTSSLLTSGGVGAAGQGLISLGLALPFIYQCLLTYSAFPLHLC